MKQIVHPRIKTLFRVGAYANLAAWYLAHWIFYNPWPVEYMARHDGTKNLFHMFNLLWLNACEQLGFWAMLIILTVLLFVIFISARPAMRRLATFIADSWHTLMMRLKDLGHRKGGSSASSEELIPQEKW